MTQLAVQKTIEIEAAIGYELPASIAPSFRDGPKDQTRNLEIPGSRFRAPRNDDKYHGRFGSNRFSSPFQQSA